jgi:hypothetical protein
MADNPSTTLYTLGRGIMYIAEWGGLAPGAYRDLGNCPKFDVEVTEENLAHYNSRSGTKNKDKSLIIETGYTVAFDLDEISLKNLKLFLKATQAGEVLHANMALEMEYALKFVSSNAAGPDASWQFWKVKIKPAGGFSLIGDTWSTLSFTGEGLTDSTNHASSPYFDVRYSTTTTTTSTSSSTSSSSSTTS